jgi:hypothetical protein
MMRSTVHIGCPLPSNEVVGEFLCAPADVINVVVALSNACGFLCGERPNGGGKVAELVREADGPEEI